jgi:hypothetical protein
MLPPDPQAEPVSPMLPLSDEQTRAFRKQIDLAKQDRKEYEPWWTANLKAYAPQPGQDPDRWAQDINTNRDFVSVERKRADLYYQRADMTLMPSPLMEGPIMGGPPQVDPMTGQPGPPTPLMGPPDAQGQAQPVPQSVALQAHQTIINAKRGPEGIDVKRMVHQALFDVLNTSGIGWVKYGYEQYASVHAIPDPMTGEVRQIPVPVKRTVYGHYFPPKQGLIPHNFRSTEWDRAPWLGMQFELPLTKANREKYHLPEDFTGSKSDTQQHFDHGRGTSEGEKVFTGVELEYRSILFRDDIVHPDHLTQLILVDGVDQPVVHQDSPHQTLDPNGALTPDSLIGFSIHPLNVRSMTDSAYPMSDSTMIRPLVNELNIYRTQQVQFRDAAVMKWQYDVERLPPEALAKIVRSPIGGMIGVPSDAFAGEGCIKELPQGSMPRETFLGQQAIDDDIARTLGIDGSGAGVQSGSSQTATAESIQNANQNARLDFDRGNVLDWDIRGTIKFSTLICRYLPVEEAAQIVGDQLAQTWDVWRKTLRSPLAFSALPDSALRTDLAQDRKKALDEYTFFANDPYVDRTYLLKKLAVKMHYDPNQLIKQPEPPKPEPPKLALSLKGEDLVAPQAPIIIEILAALGVKVSPEAIQQSQGLLLKQQQLLEAQAQEAAMLKAQTSGQPAHGGKVAQMENLSKHSVDQTGGLQGTGDPAAGNAPGGGIM